MLLTSLMLSGVAVAVVWGPVWKHDREARAQLRAERLSAAIALDRDGFRSCGARRGEAEGTFASEGSATDFAFTWLPGRVRNPRFWRVSVSGAQVTVVELPFIRDSSATRLVGRADLDPAQARKISALVRERVRSAHPQASTLFDAGSQMFHVDGSCAQDASEGWSSGSARLVMIAKILALRATRTPVEDAGRSERALAILLRSFEHGDGSEFENFARGSYTDDAWLKLGPDWTASARERSKQLQR